MRDPHFTEANDGTQLAYWAQGTGPALLFTNGFSTSTFYWQPQLERFAGQARVISWDLKGHGLSAPAESQHGATIAGCADDIFRVMDAAGEERATLIAFSVGCQIMFEAWRQQPERINAMIPILGAYGRPFDTLVSPLIGKGLWQLFRRLPAPVVDAGLGFASRASLLPGAHALNQLTGVVGARVDKETMRDFYEHMGVIDAATWLAIGRSAQQHSAEPFLHTIDVPTLVIAGGKDRFTPGDVGKQMADAIPNSELAYVPEMTHTGLFDDPQRIGDEINGFLSHNGVLPAVAGRAGARS